MGRHLVGEAVLGVLIAVAVAHAGGSVVEDAEDGVAAAEKRGDYLTALAWDDLLNDIFTTSERRAARAQHFGLLVQASLTKLGPPTTGNAEAILGTLVGLKAEANRVTGGSSSSNRLEDLKAVVASTIDPKIAEVATVLWAEVDALAARGEDARAVLIAKMLVSQGLDPGGKAALIDPLLKRIAAAHLALANQAGDTYPGARVLHARLAKLFGAEVGTMSEPGEELLREIGRNWAISADNSCGDVAFSIEAPVQRLDSLLTKRYPPGRGQYARLEVKFASCPVVVRDWETTEEQGYESKAIISERIEETDYSCGNWSTSSDAGASSTTVTRTQHCGHTPTGRFSYVDHEVDVIRTATTTIAHRMHLMSATGSITVELYGVTRTIPFSLESKSDDDTASSTSCEKGKECPNQVKTEVTRKHGWSAGQARLRMHDNLSKAIAEAIAAVVKEKAASYVTAARAAIAAGRPLEADHAYAIAHQLGSPDPAFEKWAETQYKLPRAVLLAGLGSGAFPVLEAATAYPITLPELTIRDYAAEAARDEEVTELRRLLWISFTGGATLADTTGGTATDKGGIVSLQAIGLPKKFAVAGMRFSGGYYGHGLLDLEFLGGFGGRIGGLALHGVTGLGMSTSTGNQERLGPTPDDFQVPVAAYWHYGARVSYAFTFPLKLEAMYTKAFRTSSETPVEKRFEARLFVSYFALTMRYSEYLADIDSFLGSFDASNRTAKTMWLLGGFGF